MFSDDVGVRAREYRSVASERFWVITRLSTSSFLAGLG
jgi:hypothetical protein